MSGRSPQIPSGPRVEPLVLREYQIAHFQRVLQILSIFYFFIDGSEPGSGKTYVAAALALALGLPVVVIAPLTAHPVWEDVLTRYGVSVYDLPVTGGILTYETLRSIKKHQPKHGLLVREDGAESVNFYPTIMWQAMVKAGVLLILDECQKVSNNSDQHKAVKALVKTFYQGGRSRFGLLSGTTMDKEEHAVNFMRLVNFIESRNLYSKPRGEVRLEGIQELYAWSRKINQKGTDEYISGNPFRATRAAAQAHLYGLFVQVIKPGIMSIMPNQKHDKDVKNGFYVLEPEDEEAYRKACGALAKAVRYNPATQTVQRTKDDIGAVTTAMTALQRSKVRAMARRTRELLNTPFTGPNGEVVYAKGLVYADYYDAIDTLQELLKDYKPVELTGRIKKLEARTAAVEAFQAPNHNTRLLIGNPKVGGVSVSLHDTTGYFPRFMLIMPNYDVRGSFQTTGRGARDGLIGTFICRFFYGLSGARENSILNAIARKGQILGEVHKEQGAQFPNEYEDEYEREPPAESPGFDLYQVPEETVEDMIARAQQRVTGPESLHT